MKSSRARRRALRLLSVIGMSLLLCGCVKFHIGINVEPDGSGTVGAALGMTAQAQEFIAGQGIGDISDEIRKYLEQESLAGEITEERWTDGDYEWVEYRLPFQSLEELNSRVGKTEFFESFSVTQDTELGAQTFTVDGVMTTSFLESQMPDDIEIDVTQMLDLRLIVNLPGQISETNGTTDAQNPSVVWWRISSGGPIPIHAVSEMREVTNVRWYAVAGVIALALAALVLIGFVAYRVRRRIRGSDTLDPR